MPTAKKSASEARARGIVAVAVGIVVISVLSLGTDALLHAAGVFPRWGARMPESLFAVATAYRVAYAIFGAYLAARLAPSNPRKHALVLGAVGLVISAAGAAGTWKKGPEFGPKWYPLALMVTALPCAWAGGQLGARGASERS